MAASLPVEDRAPGRDAPVRATKKQIADVRREMARVSEEVAALHEPALAKVLPVLKRAMVETAQKYERWLRDVPDGDLRFTAQKYRSVLASLEQAFRDIEQRVGGAVLDQLTDTSYRAARLAASTLENEIARLSGIFAGAEQRVSINLVSIMASGDSYLIPRFETSAARYADAHYEPGRGEAAPTNIADDIRESLAVSLASKESIYEATNRLVKLGGPTGLVALRGIKGQPGAVVEDIAEGLFNRYRPWAARIVRTETSAAYAYQNHQALWQAAKQVPGLARIWSATGDRTCAECRSLHGTVAPIGGSFVTESGDEVTDPPVHPQCGCRAAAWHESWSDVIEEADALPDEE